MGSCNKVGMTSPRWPEIVKRARAAWIWMGDNVDADTKRATFRESFRELYNTVSGKPSSVCPLGADPTVFVMAEAERISEQYQRQLGSPLYQELMRTSKEVSYPHRNAGQQLLKFFQEPSRRRRSRLLRGMFSADVSARPHMKTLQEAV